jgi:hypothetical protein
MPVNVPESVFDKYFDVIDSTFDIFGVMCQLVMVDQVEEIVYTPNNNIPEKNSINVHRLREGDYERGNKIIRDVEKLVDIKLKVYWNPKEWINVTNGIQVPNNGIQTIGMMKDLPLILKSKFLIVHKDIKDYKEMKFERFGEHIPMGLRQNRYFSCLWIRA